MSTPIRVLVSLACDACGAPMGGEADRDQTLCAKHRGPPRPRRIPPFEVRARLRRILVSRFAAVHVDVPFQAPTRAGPPVIVHRCPLRPDRTWRVTYFDKRGPAGHCYARDYREAVQLAAGEFVADLARAEFPSWEQP